MIRIPLPPQNPHHGPRALGRRLRPVLGRVEGAQVAHGEAGAVGEDFDALGAQLDGLAGGDHVERGFGGAVAFAAFHAVGGGGGVEAAGCAACAGGDVQDAGRGLGFQEEGLEGFGYDERAGAVHEVVILHVGEGGGEVASGGGVVDEGVETAVSLVHRFDGLSDRVLGRDVELEEVDLAGLVARMQVFECGLAFFEGPRAEEDVVADVGDELGDEFEADAAVGFGARCQFSALGRDGRMGWRETYVPPVTRMICFAAVEAMILLFDALGSTLDSLCLCFF